MPDSLSASRNFLSRATARVRAGIDAYTKNLDREGPEIKVAPFDSGNVSTPAALIKLGTSIAAGRRERANYEIARQDAELKREIARAHIAEIRSHADYWAGGGSRSRTQLGVTLTRPLGQWRAGDVVPKEELNAYVRLHPVRNTGPSSATTISAAKSKLALLDKEVGSYVATGEPSRVDRPIQKYLNDLQSKDPAAVREAETHLGFNAETLKIYPQRAEKAMANLRDQYRRRQSSYRRSFQAEERARLEAIIANAGGFGEPATAPAAAAPTETGYENDPLGVRGSP